MSQKIQPVLYILMRNDLASMNAGKAIAQGSHAANAFVEKMKKSSSDTSAYVKWETSTTQGFGTVIVLQCGIGEITKTVNTFFQNSYACDFVFDPSYPIKDGAVVHHIPLTTCGYVFVTDRLTDTWAKEILSEYDLY